MPIEAAGSRAQLFWRIGLWFASLLFAVFVFGAAFLGLNSVNRSFSEWAQGLWLMFRITMIFAFPVACLYLPVVIALKDATKRRPWILLVSGALIGPVCVALWSVVLLLRGVSPHEVWFGDPLLGSAGGALGSMIFAFIVGTLTTVLYILLLTIRTRLAAVSHPSTN
jgi:hypothetical protein